MIPRLPLGPNEELNSDRQIPQHILAFDNIPTIEHACMTSSPARIRLITPEERAQILSARRHRLLASHSRFLRPPVDDANMVDIDESSITITYPLFNNQPSR